MSKNTGTSELINYFDLGVNGDVGIAGSLDINTIANATTDTDTFLVSDTGIIKYRTGAQLLSDIGAQAAGNYVTTDTSQAITANKSFTVGFSLASEGSGNQTSFFRNTSSIFSGSGGSNIFGFNNSNNIYFGKGLNNGGVLQWNNTTATRYYTLPDADGTIALTSNIPANAVGGTGTTNYLPKFTGSTTIGNSNLINDASGNLGLGVTPSAWGDFKVLEFPNGVYVGTYTSGGQTMYLGANNYFDGSNYIYKLSGYATRYQQVSGAHQWHISTISGTAGNVASFTQAMTLTSGGNLLVGTTTDNGARLQVSGAATVSGSVTASASFISNVVNGYGLRLNRASVTNYNGISHATGGVERWFVGMRENLSSNNYIIYNESTGVDTLTLNSTTSAATFSGDVTISKTSPTFRLNRGTTSASSLLVYNTNGTDNWLVGTGVTGSNTNYRIYNNGLGADAIHIVNSNNNVLIGTTTDNGAKLQLGGFSGAVNQNNGIKLTNNVGTIVGLEIGGSNDSYIGTISASNFSIRTGNTERMQITSGGFLKAKGNESTYIGTASPYHELRTAQGDEWITIMSSTSGSPYGLYIRYTNSAPNNNTNYFIVLGDQNADRFRVSSNGNVTNQNGSYGAISDVKLKENIEDASPKLDDLMKVKIRNYNLIGDDKKQIGVIAQELKEVFPAMIEETPDKDKDGNNLGTTTKSVKYSVFVPMLIKAIQEQQEQIQELKNKLL